jgi:predicted pyridoxine 5'-phosphate oxidase superfamily flavin-nucleotide-binding protein
MKEKIQSLLETKEFLFMATSDNNGAPNVAPKFLLKISRNVIYLVDYAISKTWENLKINPKVSLAMLDFATLTGYRLDGTAQIVDRKAEYDRILKELQKKEIHFTATRIIEDIRAGEKSSAFELASHEKVAVYKVTVHTVAEIGPSGTVTREKV